MELQFPCGRWISDAVAMRRELLLPLRLLVTTPVPEGKGAVLVARQRYLGTEVGSVTWKLGE